MAVTYTTATTVVPSSGGNTVTFTCVVANGTPAANPVGVTIALPVTSPSVVWTQTAATSTGVTGFTASSTANVNDAAVVMPVSSSVTYTITGFVTTASGIAGVAFNPVITDPGLLAIPVTAITTSAALAINTHTPVDATAGNLAPTLPTGQVAGSTIVVEKRDSTVNTVTATGNIRGVPAQTIVLRDQYDTVTLVADAAGSWYPQNDRRTNAALDRRAAAAIMLAEYNNRRTQRGLSAAPPYMARSATMNVATTIASAVSLPFLSSPLIRLEGSPVATSTATVYAVGSIIVDELQAVAWRWQTDAARFDIQYQATAAPAFRLVVDGLIVPNPTNGSTDMWTPSVGGGGFFQMQVTNPTRQMRDYRLETTAMFPSFLIVGPTDSVVAPAPARPVMGFIGDSWTQQGGDENYSHYTARLLGAQPVQMGSGSTGYAATGGGHSAFPSLSASMIATNPDVLVIAGGLNDSNTGLQAAATSLFATFRAALPRCRIFATGPWAPSTASASSQSTKATSISAACAASGVTFIDVSTFFTGSGRVGAPVGDPNDVLISSDAIHPTGDGHAYLGARLAAAIASTLTTEART